MNPTEIQTARRVYLSDFLIDRHPESIEQFSRNCFRYAEKHSVKINAGVNGYMDWESGTGGNTIDFLVKYLGYSFPKAVRELLEYAGEDKTILRKTDIRKAIKERNKADFKLPAAKKGQFKEMYAYLVKTRGIPADIVDMLVKNKLLYQDDHNNAVFVSVDKDFYEQRGTNTYKAFHFSVGKEGNECFYFTGDLKKPDKIYVCEGSIDAVSLYAWLREPHSCYAAIGGAGKQEAIERLKNSFAKLGIPVILAVDNDKAGEECRKRNSDLEYIIPKFGKDWNEQFCNIQKTGGEQ